jgi:dGTPase
MLSRQELEKIEDRSLAPFGMRSKDSKGRAYPDPEPDYRTVFQRDRDRVLHTTAFRRLEYKTQVFINFEGDYFRTRLTHTLEVAQIGRTIARALGANEDLVESICLAHDLGHSPFGHAGESTLKKLMENSGGFDHNKQSLRIVTELEKRYPDYPGLNLSWETREGMVKHESEYDVTDARQFNPELRGNLETQICNYADELAYTTHDLDDGIRSGMITPQMLNEITLWNMLTRKNNWEGPFLQELERHRLIRDLVGLLVTDLIRTTDIHLVESNVKSALDVQKLNFNITSYSEAMQRNNRELKDFLFSNLYRHYRVVRMQVKAGMIVTDLFAAYLAEPLILPEHVQKWIPARGIERTICDYIAGMTDRYAIEEHARLHDPYLKL